MVHLYVPYFAIYSKVNVIRCESSAKRLATEHSSSLFGYEFWLYNHLSSNVARVRALGSLTTPLVWRTCATTHKTSTHIHTQTHLSHSRISRFFLNASGCLKHMMIFMGAADSNRQSGEMCAVNCDLIDTNRKYIFKQNAIICVENQTHLHRFAISEWCLGVVVRLLTFCAIRNMWTYGRINIHCMLFEEFSGYDVF